MRHVWKYELKMTDVQSINVPVEAEALSAMMQRGNLCIWLRVDPEKPKKDRYIAVLPTGVDCPPDWDHVDTFFYETENLVFHVFIQPYEAPK